MDQLNYELDKAEREIKEQKENLVREISFLKTDVINFNIEKNWHIDDIIQRAEKLKELNERLNLNKKNHKLLSDIKHDMKK